jgi:hypothetical protein
MIFAVLARNKLGRDLAKITIILINQRQKSYLLAICRSFSTQS